MHTIINESSGGISGGSAGEVYSIENQNYEGCGYWMIVRQSVGCPIAYIEKYVRLLQGYFSYIGYNVIGGGFMKYGGTLMAVKDAAASKEFYERVLEQKVVFDRGEHVTFEAGVSIQQNYAGLIGLEETDIIHKTNNFKLYFEVTDLDSWNDRLQGIKDVTFLHGIKEYPWAQRSIRIYDPDMHIIEIAESMESVIKRFAKQGLAIE